MSIRTRVHQRRAEPATRGFIPSLAGTVDMNPLERGMIERLLDDFGKEFELSREEQWEFTAGPMALSPTGRAYVFGYLHGFLSGTRSPTHPDVSEEEMDELFELVDRRENEVVQNLRGEDRD